MCDEETGCEYCGRDFSEQSLGCKLELKHPPNGPEETFVEDIASEINGRRGIGWDSLDQEVQREIRDKLREISRGAIDFYARQAEL